jgi:hypothetical protein
MAQVLLPLNHYMEHMNQQELAFALSYPQLAQKIPDPRI